MAVVATLGMASGACAGVDRIDLGTLGLYTFADGTWSYKSTSIVYADPSDLTSLTVTPCDSLTWAIDVGGNRGNLTGLMTNYRPSEDRFSFSGDITLTSATGDYAGIFQGSASGTAWGMVRGKFNQSGDPGTMNLEASAVPEPFTTVLGAGALIAACLGRSDGRAAQARWPQ